MKIKISSSTIRPGPKGKRQLVVEGKDLGNLLARVQSLHYTFGPSVPPADENPMVDAVLKQIWVLRWFNTTIIEDESKPVSKKLILMASD